MIKKHIKGIVILVIIAALIVCGVIFIPKLLSGKKAEGNVTQQINTVALTKMDLTESVSATGTIESASTATVSADVNAIKGASAGIRSFSVRKSPLNSKSVPPAGMRRGLIATM